MQYLHYLKWPLVVFVVGYIIRITGALFKIRHWPSADMLLTLGSLVMILGLAFLVIKLILYKKRE